MNLPQPFAVLEPFVPHWAVAGSNNRALLRDNSTAEQRQAFYDAAKPYMASALDYLDSKPVAHLDAAEQRLMNLCLAYAHVALAIEVQGPDEAGHAKLRAHMPISVTPADVG